MMAGTLQTVTRSLRVPLYSGCSLKCLVMMSYSAVLAACFSVGRRTSHVAKLLRQKYWHGMPAFLNSSSKTSLVSPTSLFVLRSETTSERTLGVILSAISGMGSISLPLKYLAYLPTPSFSYSSGPLCWPFQAVGLFWAGWIGLSCISLETSVSCVSPGIGSEGQFDPIRLCVVLVGVVVSPSMAEVELAARRVKELNLHLLQVWRGVLLFKKRRKNNQTQKQWKNATKTRRTPEK